MVADAELETCNVAEGALLGPEGFALHTALAGALEIGRLSVACGCVGILQACLDVSLDHTARRRPGRAALSDHQLVRRMVYGSGQALAYLGEQVS